MNLEAAISQLAANPMAAAMALTGLKQADSDLRHLGAFDNPYRTSRLLGQCAYESRRFASVEENLSYTAARIVEVWPTRFKTAADAMRYARRPEQLAEAVYGGRMGNYMEGMGWRYRGRGYIQLTGRGSYAAAGEAIGIDLEGKPELAAEPAHAWRIAAWFFATRKYRGVTPFGWCDKMHVSGGTSSYDRSITLAINGGTHGLSDRMHLCSIAHAALGKAVPAIGVQP